MEKRKRISFFAHKFCKFCKAPATTLRVSEGDWHNICDKRECHRKSLWEIFKYQRA